MWIVDNMGMGYGIDARRYQAADGRRQTTSDDGGGSGGGRAWHRHRHRATAGQTAVTADASRLQ
jgi:hypothetical protein